jgi:hypothetical protein
MTVPPAESEECAMLGYAGQCSGNHARWCSAGLVFDIDCTARGQDCMVDTCAQGAYCCDPPPPPDPSECDRLGSYGECAGETARWCSGGQIIEIDCLAEGRRCEVDTCASGAYCCS